MLLWALSYPTKISAQPQGYRNTSLCVIRQPSKKPPHFVPSITQSDRALSNTTMQVNDSRTPESKHEHLIKRLMERELFRVKLKTSSS